MEAYGKQIDYLQTMVSDLAAHIGQLSQVERDQANTMIDIGANITEIGELVFEGFGKC